MVTSLVTEYYIRLLGYLIQWLFGQSLSSVVMMQLFNNDQTAMLVNLIFASKGVPGVCVPSLNAVLFILIYS